MLVCIMTEGQGVSVAGGQSVGMNEGQMLV